MNILKCAKMHIPQKIQDLFNKTDLIVFGTSDKMGNPNVNVIFWKKIYDHESILLIDNYFKKTKSNLHENKSVCISFWDSQTEEGYQIKGEAEYFTQGEIFEKGKIFLQNKKPDRIPNGVVLIRVTKIYILTPGGESGKEL
jgi:uncharacterized protein